MGGSGESLEDWAGRMWRGSGKYMDVPRDSHAYLKAAFPGARPDSFIANVSRLYEPAAQEVRGWAFCGREARVEVPVHLARVGSSSATCKQQQQQLAEEMPTAGSEALSRYHLLPQLAAEESPYAQFIEQDLAPWQAGITRVRAGASRLPPLLSLRWV